MRLFYLLPKILIFLPPGISTDNHKQLGFFCFVFRDKINTLIKHFNDWRYWREENKCALFQGVLRKRTIGPLSMKSVSMDTEFHSHIYRKLCNSHLLKYLFIQIHLALTSRSGEPTTCINILFQLLFIFPIKVAWYTFKLKLFSLSFK